MAEELTVERLQDWARSGAHWRVLHHSERLAVVELRQCTGELVERVESREPAVIEFLDGRESDLELATGDAPSEDNDRG